MSSSAQSQHTQQHQQQQNRQQQQHHQQQQQPPLSQLLNQSLTGTGGAPNPLVDNSMFNFPQGFSGTTHPISGVNGPSPGVIGQHYQQVQAAPATNITLGEDYWEKLGNMLDSKIKVIEDKFDAAVGGLSAEVNILNEKCARYNL